MPSSSELAVPSPISAITASLQTNSLSSPRQPAGPAQSPTRIVAHSAATSSTLLLQPTRPPLCWLTTRNLLSSPPVVHVHCLTATFISLTRKPPSNATRSCTASQSYATIKITNPTFAK